MCSAGKGLRGRRALLIECRYIRSGADPLEFPRLPGRQRAGLTLQWRQGEDVPVQAPAEAVVLARLAGAVVGGQPTAAVELPRQDLTVDGVAPVGPGARLVVVLRDGRAAAVDNVDGLPP